MKYNFYILMLMVFVKCAIALEIDTHEDISVAAAEGSVLTGDSGLLADIGIEFNIFEYKGKSISQLIGDGAKFEDNTDKYPRPLNHFYDPVNNAGLFYRIRPPQTDDLIFKSPDWALEDNVIIPLQQYSLADAKRYFYSALTESNQGARDENFANLFRAIGQVIHHVQDMAQPQHVRNDAHCDNTCKDLERYGLFEPSIYEKYTKNKTEILGQFYTGYQSVSFSHARDYWHTDDGKGMADFTNHNFITEETNFRSNGAVFLYSTVGYDHPAPISESRFVRIEDVFPELADQGISGYMKFISTEVTDNLTGITDVNPHASTLSLFDQDLTLNDACVQYTLVLDPENSKTYTYDTCRAVTYNHINVAATYRFLIPRAVAYSTGLINYFFRGRIAITAVKDEVSEAGEKLYVLTVSNISRDDFAFSDGNFEIYYDTKDGRKRAEIVSGGSVSALPNSEETIIKMSVPEDVDVEKKNPFVLVYKGKIGEEEGLAARVFSGLPDTALLGWMEDWSTSKVSLWRSDDNGASWEIVIPDMDIYAINSDIISTGAGKALAIIQDYYQGTKIYRTDDNGRTWTLVEEIVRFQPTKGSEYDESDKNMLYFAVPVGYDNIANKVRLLSYTKSYVGSYNSVPEYAIIPVYSESEGAGWEPAGGGNPVSIGLTRLEQFKLLGDNTILAVGYKFDRSCDLCKPRFHQPAAFISYNGGGSWAPHNLDMSSTLRKDYASFPETERLISLEKGSWDVIPQFLLSDDYGVTWSQRVQFNSKIDQWTYAWPWFTVYLGDGVMAAYVYDDITLPATGYTIPYYEGIHISVNNGVNWQETGYRSNVTGQSPGWPVPAPSSSAHFISLGAVTRDPKKVRYVH